MGEHHQNNQQEQDKYTIIYVFVPLQESENYYKDEVVDICKIGMTTSPSLSFSDVQKSIIMRGKSTGYPYEMKVVDYLVFDKTSLKIDNIFRAIVYEFCKQQNISSRISADINNGQEFVINPGREFVYNCKKTPVDLSKKLVQYVIYGKDDPIYESVLNSCNEKILYNLNQFRGMKYFVPSGKEGSEKTGTVKELYENRNNYSGIESETDSDTGRNNGKDFQLVEIGSSVSSTSSKHSSLFNIEDNCTIAHSIFIKPQYGEIISPEINYMSEMMKTRLTQDFKNKFVDLVMEMQDIIDDMEVRYCESAEFNRLREELLSLINWLPVEKHLHEINFSDVFRFDVSIDEDEYILSLAEAVKYQYLLYYDQLSRDDISIIQAMYIMLFQILPKRYRNDYKKWNINGGTAKYTENYKFLLCKNWNKIIRKIDSRMHDKDGKTHFRFYDLYEPVENRVKLQYAISPNHIDLNNLTREQWNRIIKECKKWIGRDEIIPEDILKFVNEEMMDPEYVYRTEEDVMKIDEVIDYIDKFS